MNLFPFPGGERNTLIYIYLLLWNFVPWKPCFFGSRSMGIAFQWLSKKWKKVSMEQWFCWNNAFHGRSFQASEGSRGFAQFCIESHKTYQIPTYFHPRQKMEEGFHGRMILLEEWFCWKKFQWKKFPWKKFPWKGISLEENSQKECNRDSLVKPSRNLILWGFPMGIP